MRNKIVLDASALLAVINNEPGSELVEECLPGVVMSSVNISEAAAVLNGFGMPTAETQELINSLIGQVEVFDHQQAFIAAQLREKTKKYGLSLGDRACLSLARLKNFPVLTADKIWAKLNLGIEIKIIR